MNRIDKHVNIDFVIGYTEEMARQLRSDDELDREIARKYVDNRVDSLLMYLHQIRDEQQNANTH